MTAQAVSRVIDIHVHLEPSAQAGEDGGRSERLIAEMDAAGVSSACVFSSGGRGSDYGAETRLIASMAERLPDRIIPFARVHPYWGEEARTQLLEAVEQGVRGLKLHPFIDGAFRANDQRLVHPLLDIAAEAGLVVLVHSGWSWNSAPGLIVDLAKSFPEVPIIVGHSGLYGPHYEAALLGRDVSNVYYDTAGLALPSSVRDVAEVVGSDRVLFGSDHPHSPFGFEIGKVSEWSGLSEDDAALVLGGNAAKLLQLEGASAGIGTGAR